MATTTIDFNSVIAWSKSNCKLESIHACAGYVKDAFKTGGCQYVSGDGFNNQSFCQTNDFKCVGELNPPVDNNPRPHKGIGIQFPKGYTQQAGDICLIAHKGGVGHMCYAMGSTINDWVSDYFQIPPAQMSGTGPYCYSGSDYTCVQFWRHSSVLNGAPTIDPSLAGGILGDTSSEGTSKVTVPLPIFRKPENPITAETMKGMNENMKDYNYNVVVGTHIKQK